MKKLAQLVLVTGLLTTACVASAQDHCAVVQPVQPTRRRRYENLAGTSPHKTPDRHQSAHHMTHPHAAYGEPFIAAMRSLDPEEVLISDRILLKLSRD